MTGLDVRKDFPILHQEVHGRPLVYLDSAATSQKPQVVIDALADYYARDNANVHRGVHRLSERATEAYEGARARIRRFLNAAHPREIVFVRGTTEGINLVAQAYGRQTVGPGDEVVITALEHHSNIVPWQMLCEEKGAALRVVPIDDAGEVDVDAYERLLGERTRLVAIAHVSNALGTILPVKRMIEAAHRRGIAVLVDGAQAVPHLRVDVRDLDCDFYTFSGHKTYGPTGIGALYGKAERLERMPPYQGGGDMIKSVAFEKTIYNDLPYKFEAGTPHIAGAIGLGAALDYLADLGLDRIAAYEHELLVHATERVSSIPGVRLIGTAQEKAGVLSFLVDGIHAHDVGTILD
ncbi:MAG: SufS family cysteine desulfurase, partial [Candidatus Rokuibacteriota bacterium]